MIAVINHTPSTHESDKKTQILPLASYCCVRWRAVVRSAHFLQPPSQTASTASLNSWDALTYFWGFLMASQAD